MTNPRSEIEAFDFVVTCVHIYKKTFDDRAKSKAD